MCSTLDGGAASLKFRQFKSAVCDAFGVILFFEEFEELLVVNYLLRTCISLTCTCTATTTGHFTWGVFF